MAPLTVGCASGESIESLERASDLARDEVPLINAELIVEVADEGHPVVADAVWLVDGSGDRTQAYCMVHEGLGRCATWFGQVQSEGPISVVAEVCGESFSEQLLFAVEPGADDLSFSSHFTVRADATQCGRTPQSCEDMSTEPALSVSIVDGQGDAIAAGAVQIEREDGTIAPADCIEGFAGAGCSEWASQYRWMGRYRAVASHCGETFRTDWINVGADDSGCKAIAEAVELVVQSEACDYGI